MQCNNCQFENLPGVAVCGRCGASLQLASMAIDVHPPRASRAAKFRRRWLPFGYYVATLGNTLRRVFPRARLPELAADLPAVGVLGRMVVPGWAQRHLGRAGRARWMFWGFLASLFLGLLTFGSAVGWSLVGLAIAIQAASIVDVVAAGPACELRQRLIYALATIAALGLFIYYPAARLVAQVAAPQQFDVAAPPFAAGDVVLVNPSAYRRSSPQPGDVVFYSLSGQRLGNGHFWYQLEGDRVDRVLAVAGQKVTTTGGELLVDGRASPWRPLNRGRLPVGLDVTIPQDCCLIFASADAQPYPLPVILAMSIVSRAQIRGRVYCRSYPPWRLAIIR